MILKKYLRVIVLALFMVLCFTVISSAGTPEYNDKNCIRAVIGEASNQGYKGMLAVACGIRNRGTLKGVYGAKSHHIDKEPKWVWKQAEKAWKESKYNRVHEGTMWENIVEFGKPSWYDSVEEVYRYKDHVFFEERR